MSQVSKDAKQAGKLTDLIRQEHVATLLRVGSDGSITETKETGSSPACRESAGSG